MHTIYIYVVRVVSREWGSAFFCEIIWYSFCWNKINCYFCIVKQIKHEPMGKGFLLRVDFVKKFGFKGTTLIVASLLADALKNSDGWLVMQQDEMAEMFGVSKMRINQIFRKLKEDGFILQKRADGGFNNRKVYKFNEEKLK